MSTYSTYAKYVNGYTNPRFGVLTGNPFMTVFDLKAKPGAITEIIEEHYLLYDIIDGRKDQHFLWSHYYFELDFSQFIQTEDLMKFRDILNYEQRSFDFIYYPELGSGRSFICMTVKDRIVLNRMGFRQGHTDFKRVIGTRYPLTLQQRPQGTIWWLPVTGGTGTAVEDGHGYRFLGYNESQLVGDEEFVIII